MDKGILYFHMGSLIDNLSKGEMTTKPEYRHELITVLAQARTLLKAPTDIHKMTIASNLKEVRNAMFPSNGPDVARDAMIAAENEVLAGIHWTHVPTWDAVLEKVSNGEPLNHLENFVHEQEPEHEDSVAEWREQLEKVLGIEA